MAMRLVLFPILWLSLQAYSQVAERPEYKVGDTWRVQRFDLMKGEVTGSREWRIAEVSPTSTTQEFKNPATGAVTRWTRDLDGNWLEIGGRKFDPNYTLYSFPLSVGKKWTGKVTYPNLDGHGTVNEERTCQVLAIEDVATKAGTFKAYKIQCDGVFTMDHNFVKRGFAGHSSSTDWFSPEVKRSVKREVRSTRVRGGWSEQYVEEVISFELQK